MAARLLGVVCMLAVVVTARKLGIDHTDVPHFGRVPERSRLCVNMLAVHRSNEDGEVGRACNHTRVIIKMLEQL